MIRIFTLIEMTLLICVLFMADMLLLVPIDLISLAAQNFIVGCVGLVLAIYLLPKVLRSEEIICEMRMAGKCLCLVGLVYFVSIIMTWLNYGYSIKSVLIVLAPCLLLSFVIPFVYVFHCKGNCIVTQRWIYIVAIVMLLVKMITWYLYNFKGMMIFPQLILPYKDWVRDGMQRLDLSCFFIMVFSWTVVQVLFEDWKKKIVYVIILSFLFFYAYFVAAIRYTTISMIIVLVVASYLKISVINEKRNKLIKMFIFFAIIIGSMLIIIASGMFEQIIGSFSISNKDNGISTLARLLTFVHYYHIMINEEAIFGLGLLDNSNPKALLYLYKTPTLSYYLEDLGALGGAVRFGVMSIFLYGGIFYYLFRVSLKEKNRNVKMYIYFLCLSIFTLLTQATTNIFEGRQFFLLALIVAMFSYSECKEIRKI